MTLHYRRSDPTDLRDLGSLMSEWTEAGNPKAQEWLPAPERPSDQAIWDGTGWISPSDTPPPDWSTFKTTLLADPAANAALAAALPQAPGAVLALPAALMAMAEGGNPEDFYAAWGALRAASLIPEPLQTAISALAHACNLPPEVVGFLG